MFRKIWLISALLAPTVLHADTVTASWYGDHWDGRPTASGCIFHADGYSAASRTLPFGTVLLVERAGREVVVVINDRGPFIAGRQLDLSRAAADALGMRRIGVAPVHVQIVAYRAARCVTPPPASVQAPTKPPPAAGPGLMVTSR